MSSAEALFEGGEELEGLDAILEEFFDEEEEVGVGGDVVLEVEDGGEGVVVDSEEAVGGFSEGVEGGGAEGGGVAGEGGEDLGGPALESQVESLDLGIEPAGLLIVGVQLGDVPLFPVVVGAFTAVFGDTTGRLTAKASSHSYKLTII